MTMNRTDDGIDGALDAGFGALRRAASAIEPPPELEAQLRRRLFAAAPASRSVAVLPVAASPVPGSTTLPARRLPAVRESSGVAALAGRWAAWLAWPVSVMASMMLCSWMLVAQPALEAPVDPSGTGTAPATQPSGPTDNGTPFLALAPIEEITAAGRSEIITASVPRATLAEFGLPVSPMHAADDISAEFLVAPSGGVLAVRFVSADVR